MKFFIYPWAIAGDKSTIPDNAQPDGSASYQMGFTSDYQLVYGVDPNAKAVPRYGFNELLFDVTTAIKAWQTDAIPPFITSVMNLGTPYSYNQYALVRFDDGSGVQVYWSKVNSNTTDPTNLTNWGIFSTDGWQPGDCKEYVGNQSPASLGRWLATDGTIYSIATYPRLAAAIGNIWGGDGITTFAVPNFQRRTTIGSGGTASGTIGNAVGNIGGAETHSLSAAENGPHNHAWHWANSPAGNKDCISWYGTSSGTVHFDDPGSATWHAEDTIAIDNSGSGTPHNIMQPSAVVQKLIRY